MDMLCTLLVSLIWHGDVFGRRKSVENGPSMLKFHLDHSDPHFGRYSHAARCFRLGQACHGPDQHLGKLPLWFVGPSVDGCLNGMCFSLEIGLLHRRYMKIADIRGRS